MHFTHFSAKLIIVARPIKFNCCKHRKDSLGSKVAQKHSIPSSNKPGTAQVGAISKAQKQQKDFKVSSILFYSTRVRKKLKKKSEFFLIFKRFFWSPVCRIVPKNVKEKFLNIHSFAKWKKNEGGTLWRH